MSITVNYLNYILVLMSDKHLKLLNVSKHTASQINSQLTALLQYDKINNIRYLLNDSNQ